MSSYMCEICSEEKQISEMTLCGNGHFGGCQKCHMEFIKTSYKKTLNVFGGGVPQVQHCMFCREDLRDIQMGEDWGIKLHRLQPIMMYNHLKQQGHLDQFPRLPLFEGGEGREGELTLKEIISRHNLMLRKPKSFSYEWIKDVMAEKGISLKFICSFMDELDEDMSKNQIKTLFKDIIR